MNQRSSCFFLVLALAPPASFGALPQPVMVKSGLVAGVAASDSSITVFRGIPFAAPPVGDLRWRAPRPAAVWKGVRRADRFSASCIQSVVTERKPWTFEFMTQATSARTASI